eukprot:10980679-Lingulodinium_polyedra.AAC.1
MPAPGVLQPRGSTSHARAPNPGCPNRGGVCAPVPGVRRPVLGDEHEVASNASTPKSLEELLSLAPVEVEGEDDGGLV